MNIPGMRQVGKLYLNTNEIIGLALGSDRILSSHETPELGLVTSIHPKPCH